MLEMPCLPEMHGRVRATPVVCMQATAPGADPECKNGLQARVKAVDPSTGAEVDRELARMAARRKAAEGKQRSELSSFLNR